MAMKTLAIDIETYSSIDLRTSGVFAYTEANDFEILLFAYAFDDEEVQIIDLAQGEELPNEIIEALTDPSIIKTAFNAQFERTCLSLSGTSFNFPGGISIRSPSISSNSFLPSSFSSFVRLSKDFENIFSSSYPASSSTLATFSSDEYLLVLLPSTNLKPGHCFPLFAASLNAYSSTSLAHFTKSSIVSRTSTISSSVRVGGGLKSKQAKGEGRTFTVPQGSYFFLGDNRPISVDARYWTNPYIPEDKIIGKATFRFFPLNRIGKLE
jgi:hypothetical protein